MSCLSGVQAQGVVGAIRRHVGLQLETLVLCDAARGDGVHTDSGRGFYRLLSVGQNPCPVLGQRLNTYETGPNNCGALRPYKLSSFLACAAFCASSGLTFFSEGHEIRTLDAHNVVGRVLCEVQFCYPSSMALSDETLWITDAHGLHVLRLIFVADGVVATSVSSRSHDEDWRGQIGYSSANGCQVMFSATAVYKDSAADGSWQLWAGSEDGRGVADGAGQDARFSSITAVGIGGDGAALVLDAQHDGSTVVRYINGEGYVKTIYRPSTPDEALDNEIGCGGELLSCDSGLASPSGSSYATCPLDPAPPSAEPLEGAFCGGGLRCPLVLDDLLVLCAPLQDTILFLQAPGLREPSCHSGRLSPTRSCSSASCLAAPRHAGGDACCNQNAARVRAHDNVQSFDDTSSCGSCSSSTTGCVARRVNGSRAGRGPMGSLEGGLGPQKSIARTVCVDSSQFLNDEIEVSSKVSCTRTASFLARRPGKRPAGPAGGGGWTRKGSAARKRFCR